MALKQEVSKFRTKQKKKKQLELEKYTSDTALFPSKIKILKKFDAESICKERACKQSSCNHQHNTNSYNSYLSPSNTSNMTGSPSVNSRGSPKNQYIRSSYSPQKDLLNPQGQLSYPGKPIKTFNTSKRTDVTHIDRTVILT